MDLSGDSQSSVRQTYEAYSYFDCLIRRLVHCRERVCDARHCILASCRFIHQSEIFSRKHASSVLRQLPVRPPRTSLSNPCLSPLTTRLQQPLPSGWAARIDPASGKTYYANAAFVPRRGEVAHANILLHVRCGQDSLVACRLASSGDVAVHARTSLFWTHCIIAHVHLHHRRRILETLVANENSRSMVGPLWGDQEMLRLRTCPYCDGMGGEVFSWTGARCFRCYGSGRLRPFRLHTFHNKFVSPQADGTVVQADAPGTLELLEAIFMPDGRVAFRTIHDTFLTAMNAEHNWEVRQHSKPHAIEEWEKFEVVFVNDYQLALKSHHGSFLSATDKAGMTQQPWLMTWETFDAPWLLRACRIHSLRAAANKYWATAYSTK
jgi:hypothetical protein